MIDPDVPFILPPFDRKTFDKHAASAILDKLKGTAYDDKTPPGRGISAQEATALLDWLVAGTVNTMESMFPPREKSWYDYIHGKCTMALDTSPLPHTLSADCYHSFNMRHFSGTRHGAYLVHLPIQVGNKGGYEWTHYLIDPTFGQFFHESEVGPRLVATGEGKVFADHLLRHGHANLTEAAAELYVKAFDPELRCKHRLEKCGNSYIALLCCPEMSQRKAAWDARHEREWGMGL